MENAQHNIAFGDKIPASDADPKSTGMKNAVIWGGLIGVLSGLWIFTTYWLGYTTRLNGDEISTFEYSSGFIPLIGLFFGVRYFRNNYKNGSMNFFEALVESFKILIVGGVMAAVFAMIFMTSISAINIVEFSGRIFGALLIGVLSSLVVSLSLMTTPRLI
ncbi:MAG: DUF4199 domain-containing protein [Sphingobacteriaceae bacterium]